jgi:hypothetical protein
MEQLTFFIVWAEKINQCPEIACPSVGLSCSRGRDQPTQIELGNFWQGKSKVNMHTVLAFADITVQDAVAKVDFCSLAKLCVSNKQSVIFIDYF